eukprot:955370-Prymnesium_polylepis.1
MVVRSNTWLCAPRFCRCPGADEPFRRAHGHCDRHGGQGLAPARRHTAAASSSSAVVGRGGDHRRRVRRPL